MENVLFVYIDLVKFSVSAKGKNFEYASFDERAGARIGRLAEETSIDNEDLIGAVCLDLKALVIMVVAWWLSAGNRTGAADKDER